MALLNEIVILGSFDYDFNPDRRTSESENQENITVCVAAHMCKVIEGRICAIVY